MMLISHLERDIEIYWIRLVLHHIVEAYGKFIMYKADFCGGWRDSAKFGMEQEVDHILMLPVLSSNCPVICCFLGQPSRILQV
jgi:hypothetical protein